LEIGFLSHALFKIDRHTARVYPREAYGFCLGMAELAIVLVALPVGETAGRGDSADRFGDVGRAFAPADKLASSFNLRILALYHAHADAIAAPPLASVSEEFIDKPILVNEVVEGKLRREPSYYMKHPGKGWQKSEAKRVARKIWLGGCNPRLVLSRWDMIWGKITQP